MGCPEGQELNEFDVCVDITNGDDERNGVTTGVLDGLISSNGLLFEGLPYGDAAKAEINGDTLTLRALKLTRTVDGETPSLSAELVNATITVFKGEDDKEWHAQVVIDGVTSPEFELKAKHEFTVGETTYTFHIDEATDNIFIVDASSTINPNFDAGDLDGVLYRAYTGFETDPAILDLLEGETAIANYAGDFDVLLASTEDEVDLEIAGTIALTADFAAGTIADGLMTATVDADVLTIDFSGDILVPDSGGISGNGWNATITDINIDLDATEDDISLVGGDGGQLDGVFYGQDGEETAGTIIIDATLTYDEDEFADFDIVGGGGFVADCTVDVDCFVLPDP